MSAVTATVIDPAGHPLPEGQRRVIRWTLYIGFAALVAGIFHGLANALSYAKIDIVGYFPGLRTYYQGLTAHGVANVLIFTFSFSNGFLPLLVGRALARPLRTALLWTTFLLLLAGDALTIYAVVSNQASVLYTAYAPLQAHWTYYIGLALVVVSTWVALLNMLLTLRDWRRASDPADRIPLLAYISVVSYVMWFLASLPIAVSFLGILTPWTLGILPKVDPLLTRTLFWFTGHAIVYAWLLPAYVSWYALIPRQVGGALISDSYTRMVWILFLLLSIPTGMHHQYTDPGITTSMKAVQGVLTFGVFFPSLATAFSVMAALEIGGRRAGGRGLLGWVTKLPWGDPSVTAQLLAMLTFVLGGATGLVNASYVDEPGDPQHHLGAGPLPHDGGHGGGAHLHGHRLLADSLPYRSSLVEPRNGARLVVDLHGGRADLRARDDLGRPGGHAAPDVHGAGDLLQPGVAARRHSHGHRRHADVHRDPPLLHRHRHDHRRRQAR